MAPALLQFPLGADVFGLYDPQTYLVGVNAPAQTPGGDCTVSVGGLSLTASVGTLSPSARGQQLGQHLRWWTRLRKQWRPAQRKLVSAPMLQEALDESQRTVLALGVTLSTVLGDLSIGSGPEFVATESGLRIPHWVRKALRWRPVQRRVSAPGFLQTPATNGTVPVSGVALQGTLGPVSVTRIESRTAQVSGSALLSASGLATVTLSAAGTVLPAGVPFQALHGQALVVTATTHAVSGRSVALGLGSVSTGVQQGLVVQPTGQTVLALLGTVGSRSTGRVEFVGGATFDITTHTTRVLATIGMQAGASADFSALAVRLAQVNARAGATISVAATRQLIAATQMHAGARLLIASLRAPSTISLYGPFDADQQFGEGE
jgi:hypothetical protein